MPSAPLEIASYQVILHGGPDGVAGISAVINLDIPNGTGSLRFYPTGATLPANKFAVLSGGTTIFYASYRYEQLANVLDVLRNEKPVKFFFSETTLASHLTTSDEPVGEGEA